MGECYGTSCNFGASSDCGGLNKSIKVYLLHDLQLDDYKSGNSCGIVALSLCNVCCHSTVNSLDE